MVSTERGSQIAKFLAMSKHLAQNERNSLCDLFDQVGPSHPTLCEGWNTAELAAHLIIRERSIKALGLVMTGYPAKKLAEATKRLAEKKPFDQLVNKVRLGPPFYLKGIDGAMNLFEFFVHHEDVLRNEKNPDPRNDISELDEAIWKRQSGFSKLLIRGLKDIDLTLSRPSGETIHVGGGGRPVVAHGAPTEIALYLFGRRKYSQIELSGDPDAIREMETGQLGG